MASRKKRSTIKSRNRKTRATRRKKTAKRAAVRQTKKSAKKRATKTRRSDPSRRIKSRQQKGGATPVLQETVVDIIDEPLPGVVRVTEIEETEVRGLETDERE